MGKNITRYIQTQHPKSFMVLNDLHLTTEQRMGLLQVLPRMNDPRIQSLGLEISQAVKECGQMGRLCVKNKFMERFQPRFGEIRQLRDEIIPSALLKRDDEWGVTIDPEQMTLMKTLPSNWKLEVDMSPLEGRRLMENSTKMVKIKDAFGVITAFAEQARILLDQVDRLSRIFGHELKIPGWSRALVGAIDLASGMASCVMDAKTNPSMMMLCPFRFESAAADLFKLFTGSHAPWRKNGTTSWHPAFTFPTTTSIIR